MSKFQLPTSPPVEVDKPFKDSRGVIQNVLHRPVGSVVVIESKAGSVRAQHYHRTDWHFCFVVSGCIKYLERPVGSKEDPKEYLFRAGALFFTPPLVEHAMFFPEDTVFLTLANRHRTPEDYESDLVRLTMPLVPVPTP